MSSRSWLDSCDVPTGRSLTADRAAAEGAAFVAHQTASAEIGRPTADVLSQAAQAVETGANPVGGSARFAEHPLEVPVLNRQYDAVVVRAREPARPHHVAVSPILEHAALGDENPAVRPL